MRSVSYANPDVLEFYRVMPFNFMASAHAQAAAVAEHNVVQQQYGVLEPLLVPGVRILDVGCGTGWLAQTLAYHYQAAVTGIDFNPVAIARAQETAAVARLTVTFVAADLFEYTPPQPFAIVTSLGVLHHTDNCLAAVRRCAETFLAPGGTLFLGLYHAFGRKPFLDAFAARKQAGASEDALFNEYARLRPNDETEPTLLRSWFRDQVLHPRETQHTLAEIVPVLESCGLTIAATSVNGFREISSLGALYQGEQQLFDIGREALARGEFYPGFFIVVARKGS
jgi:SAM-dependent methyltransferase